MAAFGLEWAVMCDAERARRDLRTIRWLLGVTTALVIGLGIANICVSLAILARLP
jgi:hypothetical protein